VPSSCVRTRWSSMILSYIVRPAFATVTARRAVAPRARRAVAPRARRASPRVIARVAPATRIVARVVVIARRRVAPSRALSHPPPPRGARKIPPIYCKVNVEYVTSFGSASRSLGPRWLSVHRARERCEKRRPTDRATRIDRARTSRAPRGRRSDRRASTPTRARARFERRGRFERRDATRTRARGTRSFGFRISGVVGRAR